MVRVHRWPLSFPRDGRFRMEAGGVEVPVFPTDVAPYAIWEADGPADVAIFGAEADDRVHPRSAAVPSEDDRGVLHATLPGPGSYWVGGPGRAILHLFVHPVADEPAWASAPDTLRFEAGTFTDAGAIVLKPGQNLYVAGGAVVRGCVQASGSDGLHIGGRGIMDMGEVAHDGRRHFVQLDGCRNALVEDLTLVRPQSWMIVLGGCEDVEVAGVREIGGRIGSDGVDVVGSRHVRIRGCGFRNNDDNIAVKAFDRRARDPRIGADWSRPVEDVWVEGCVFLNDRGGNSLEIGHELQTERVSNITFRNLDIGSVHGVGAPISIHAGDRATVEDVLFEDLRIEHHYEKFLDLRVMRSQFNHDPERGRIRRVTLRRIHADAADFNWGYTTSTIGGWDADHRVEDLVFEDVTYGDVRVRSLDDLEIFTRHLGRVEFR